MNEFIAMLEVVVWPGTVLILAFGFRRELRRAFGRLTSLRYKDFEAKFERQLGELEAKAQAAVQLPASVHIALPSRVAGLVDLDQLLRLVDVSPRAAILEAWLAVEQAATDLAEAIGITIRRGIVRPRDVWDMAQREVIDQDTHRLFDQMRHLRNQAAHAPEFVLSSDEAERYIRLAVALSQRLQQAKPA